MISGATFPEFKGASVLITGGGSGIGAALTEGFCEQSAKVAFLDIAADESETLAEEINQRHANKPLFIKCDLADVDALRAASAEAAAAHGTVSILINNAAWDDRHDVMDVTEDYWEHNTAINQRHQFFAIQSVVDGMKSMGGGAIVNLTSTSFMLNEGAMPAYTTSKAGIIGLTKGMAGYLAPHNIRVNALAPGWVMTKRQKELWATPEAMKEFVKRQTVRRELQPEDMVGPCLFLASKAAAAISAQVIIADGGLL
ncbi:MAG: SDR family oxidoreductase [Pseudomonadota bacterium]